MRVILTNAWFNASGLSNNIFLGCVSILIILSIQCSYINISALNLSSPIVLNFN